MAEQSTKEQARPSRTNTEPDREPESEPAATATARERWQQRLRAGLRLLARLVGLITGILVAIIVLTILFKVLDANRDNSIVTAAFDVSDKLVGPLDDVFTLKNRKAEVAVNYGLAALVYLVAGRVVARALRRAAQ